MATTTGSARADATGAATVPFVVSLGASWTVTGVTVSSTSGATSQCRLFLGSLMICGSSNGNEDTADGSPVTALPGDTVALVWAGLDPGAVATATLVYDLGPA